MARATGIHISGSMVRVSDVEGSDKKMKLRGFGEAPIAPGEDDRVNALTKAIKDAFKASKAGREHVIVGIPVRDCIIREITVPFTEVEQISKVIKFESEPHLHSCSIDEVVICFHKVGSIGNRSIVLVIAAKKDKLAQILEAVERAGVDPLAVDVDIAGLYGLSQNMPDVAEHRNYVVVEIGATTSLITLVQDGTLRIVRSIRLGYDSITSRVSKDLEIDATEARTRTHQILQLERQVTEDLFVKTTDVADAGKVSGRTSNELQRDIIRQRSNDLLVRLEQEIIRTIDNVKLTVPVECVYLTGAGSQIPRITDDLSLKLKVPVSHLDPVSSMEHKLAGEALENARATAPTSIGLAAKHLGVDPLKFDFRQEEFVFAKKFDRLKLPLLSTVVLLALVNVAWFAHEKKTRERQTAIVTAVSKKANDEFLGLKNQMVKNASYRKVSGIETAILDKKIAQANTFETGQDRIDYIKSTVRGFHSDLRKKFNLDQVSTNRRATLRDGTKPAEGGGTARNVSALRRWEQVWKGIAAAEIRDMSVNALKVTPAQVDIALTLPDTWTAKDGSPLDIQRQMALIKKNLEQMPKEEGFLEMTFVNQVARQDNHGWDFSKVSISFKKEEGF